MKSTLIIILSFLVSMSFAQTPGTLKWSFDASDEIAGCPAIADDGTIYVGSKDNKLYAINADGSQKWEFEAAGTISAAPAIGNDGTIYFGSFMSKFYALNPDGSLKWYYTTGVLNDNSPAIGSDGTIYNPSSDGLYAFKPDGTLKWKYEHFNAYSTPAIAKDGTIYLGVSTDFYAFNPDGTLKWRIKIGEIESSPAIGADGTIYVGSKDKNLYALNQDGTVKWKFSTGGLIIASPVIDADGVIYIGSYDYKLYAVNPDGTEKWSFLSGFSFFRTAAAAIGDNGIVYAAVTNVDAFWEQKLVALNSDGSIKWEYATDLTLYSATNIGADGTVYIGTGEGKLLAVHGESTGLANSSWPKLRGNNKNSGFNSFVTGVEKHKVLVPFKSKVFPNPISDKASIDFVLPSNGIVKIKVYNALGVELCEILNSSLPGGFHTVEFDSEKIRCESGLLFYTIESNGSFESGSMMMK